MKSNLANAFQKNAKPKKENQLAEAGQARGRMGKKPFQIFVDAEVIKQLKRLAIDTGKSQQELGEEALNELFAKYGKAQIAG